MPQKCRANAAAGATLAKARESLSQRKSKTKACFSDRHSVALVAEDKVNVENKSVVDETGLNEFFSSAQIAGATFAAEKLTSKFICQGTHVNPLNSGSGASPSKLIAPSKKALAIPRRPPWTKDMTPLELDEAEKSAFLAWRRTLAELEKEEGIVLTPFERNLEFWRQLWRVVEKSDIVVQIVDARNPLLFRCSDFEKYVHEVSRYKKNFLLLNKADMLTEDQRSAWAAYFRSINLPVAFWSAVEQDIPSSCRSACDIESITSDKSDITENSTAPSKSASLNANSCEDVGEDNENVADDNRAAADSNESDWETDSNASSVIDSVSSSSQENDVSLQQTELWQNKLVATKELIEMFKAVGRTVIKETGSLTVGLVGYPNVGKSSTINKILGQKKVSVSATPGKTKHFQTLYVDQELILCDCPGLVMPSYATSKSQMLLWGILPIDQLRECFEPVSLVCRLIPLNVLEKAYAIMLPKSTSEEQKMSTAQELLTVYAFQRGFMTSKGMPDWQRAARIILKDFTKGRLAYCTPPPGVEQETFNQYSSVKISDPSVTAKLASKQKQENVVLKTLAKRHILDSKKEENLDAAFFHDGPFTAHMKGSKGIGTLSKTDSMADGLPGKPWKKHNNRNSKEKLRRRFADLNI